MRILVSPHATEERLLFPDKPNTKRRRRRTLGKYGRLSARFPAAFIIAGRTVMHPRIYDELRRQNMKNNVATTGPYT